MNKNSKLVKKHFRFIINIFFITAIIVLFSQILKQGLKIENKKMYDVLLSLLDIIFSLFSIFISYFLIKKKTIYFLLIRLLFFLISIFYFINSLQVFLNINYFNLPIKEIGFLLSIYISCLSFSYKITRLAHTKLHPAVLFVLSFLMIIFLGSILLILPSSIKKEISYIDSLFISASAVTVTGLSTLSIENDFTQFGQIVLLFLIQLGGLGILTFSNLFALLFHSESSFKNRILIGGIINESNSRNIFRTLFKIFSLTILLELLGCILIFFTVDRRYIKNPLFFSIFHSISAFCNAGFSTLDYQFSSSIFRYNYMLQFIIASLIITGGLGYNIMINYYSIIKMNIFKLVNFFFKKRVFNNIMINRTNINTQIVVYTTIILITIGTICFFIIEYNHTLKSYSSIYEKIFISFFNSVSARTGGFINLNYSEILVPTSLLISFLMWIGASPGSTGGGIKTTTFAIGIIGLFNHIKGKNRITISWKEIPTITLNLVNSTIIVSIFIIGIGTFFLTIIEKRTNLINLLFEVISAYSTVGLSLGVTKELCNSSKLILIFIMFLGRVGCITFLIGIYRQFFKEERQEYRIYPKEKVYI